jgi:hypothetical protein
MQPGGSGAKDGQAAHQHHAGLRARSVDYGHARQFRLKALAEETREKPPNKPVFEMHLHHVGGIPAAVA